MKHALIALSVVAILAIGGALYLKESPSPINDQLTTENTITTVTTENMNISKMSEFKGGYYSFSSPASWQVDGEYDPNITVEEYRDIAGEEVQVVSFSVGLVDSKKVTDLKKHLFLELSSVGKVLSEKDITVSNSMENRGIEIVGQQEGDADSTIVATSVLYSLEKPVANKGGVMMDSIVVSGYYAGSVGGKDVFTDAEKKQVQAFLESVAAK